jgi:hypothetical protein
MEEGDPIIPYKLKVTIPINHSCEYIDPVVSGLPYPSQDFSDFFDTYARNTENVVKVFPEFTTQDSNRNSTWSVQVVGPNYDDPAKTDYLITQNFTIENAEVEIETNAQTDLTGTDLTAFLQAAADQAAANYLAGRPWTSLP